MNRAIMWLGGTSCISASLSTRSCNSYCRYRDRSRVKKARLSCINSGHEFKDHFADVSNMVSVGSGAQREIRTVVLSRYACYLAIQNADPENKRGNL